jgi:hypothetical protein
MRKKINPEETVSISFEFILTIQRKFQKAVLVLPWHPRKFFFLDVALG